jgi:SAM-dependent methyltransferase
VRPVSSSRWNEAQEHERDFWKNWRALAPYREVDLDAYWAGEIAKFGIAPEFFLGRRVLDVGCGPVGLIHFLPQAALRMRIDPLLHLYDGKALLAPPSMSASAAGEQLPFRDAAADVLICFNALDHMRDPSTALREMRRVLRPGGTLLMMIHTFPAWTMPLLAVDRLHPHHWTHKQFVARVGEAFRVTRAHRERRTFPLTWRERLAPRTWKYSAAGLVLSTTYVVAEL